ncbi:hypothetical protein TRIUR3_17635 [Triticum urartu]|uniref:Disease resistance N-terminal domain-containing protein n=1 Tax=Triticum urartu TaxID=4572 RepID=M7Z9G1_TRIUA|nr:hypothetical protein TRIUR3_17635 [Triticum urartu]
MAMSGLGGVIAGAVAKQIVGKLFAGGEYAAAEITLQWRYREDVLEMAEKMKDLEAVLGDADERSRRGGEGGMVFQRWLTKFKRVAYDVEDVLDELDANELISKTQSKVVLLVPGAAEESLATVKTIGLEPAAPRSYLS